MYSVDEIRQLHIELSSNCNARCPLCPRNIHGYPYNTGYDETNLSLAKLQSLLSEDFVKQLNKILINGNYGDFVMNPESVDIIRWFLKVNPNIIIHVSTNGGARNKEFWQELGELGIEISFCIDGLEDTHHIYRQDTTYTQVIKNATTFINAGGRATWKMVLFDHNKHQIEEATRRSVNLGFENFNLRDEGRDKGAVYNRQGQKIFKLKNIDHNLPDQINDSFIKEYQEHRKTFDISYEQKTIKCEVKKQKSMYITSTGKLAPCCYLQLGNTLPRFRSGIEELENDTTVHRAVDLFNEIEKTFTSDKQLTACQTFCGE